MKKFIIFIFLLSGSCFFCFEIMKEKPLTPIHPAKKGFKIIDKSPISIEFNKKNIKSTSENDLKKNDIVFNSQSIVVDTIKFDINTSFEDKKYYSNFLESYQKGDYENVLIYGKNILKIPDKYSENYWYGNVIHTTNIILGKVSFTLGNIQESEFYLLNSVNIKYISKTQDMMYSPQLASFGPDTSLAFDLYKAGRRESVLKYFQNLKSFWKTGVENGYIENSINNIKNGAKKKSGEDDSDYDQVFGFPFKGGLFSIPRGD